MEYHSMLFLGRVAGKVTRRQHRVDLRIISRIHLETPAAPVQRHPFHEVVYRKGLFTPQWAVTTYAPYG
jgi:hypothetical protein